MTNQAETDVTINLSGPRRGSLEREINGALISCVDAHGPITKENVSSASKRVISAIKTFNKRQVASPPPPAGESGAGCPRCGAEWQGMQWACGSYPRGSSVVDESGRWHSPQCRIAQLTTDLAAATSRAEELDANVAKLTRQRDALQGFKDWVHNWLDKAGVPEDPSPEHTIMCGCRISGRMEWLKRRAEAAERDNDALLRLVDMCNPEVRYALDQTTSASHEMGLKILIARRKAGSAVEELDWVLGILKEHQSSLLAGPWDDYEEKLGDELIAEWLNETIHEIQLRRIPLVQALDAAAAGKGVGG